MQSHEFFREAIEILSASSVRDSLGLQSNSSVYRLARHPSDDTDPDGTGARNPVDRMDALKDRLASYPEGRALLARWQMREDAEHSRRVGGAYRVRLTASTLAKETSDSVKEFAEFLACCTPYAFDPERVIREGSEAIAEIQDLIHAARSWQEEQDSRIEPALRKIG